MSARDGALDTAAIQRQLDLVLERLARLEALLSESRAARVSRDDCQRLARLLPAVAGAWGSRLFSSGELVAAQEPALRLVVGPMGAKTIGRLLRRGEGLSLGGFAVERAGVEGHATVWRVVRSV